MKISANVIPRERIIQIAKEESESRGWKWSEPIRVSLGIRHYTILTNINSKGGNILMTVNAYSGKVKKAVVWPR